jgi:hypothetical protein
MPVAASIAFAIAGTASGAKAEADGRRGDRQRTSNSFGQDVRWPSATKVAKNAKEGTETCLAEAVKGRRRIHFSVPLSCTTLRHRGADVGRGRGARQPADDDDIVVGMDRLKIYRPEISD